jgi:hypothetical protein
MFLKCVSYIYMYIYILLLKITLFRLTFISFQNIFSGYKTEQILRRWDAFR